MWVTAHAIKYDGEFVIKQSVIEKYLTSKNTKVRTPIETSCKTLFNYNSSFHSSISKIPEQLEMYDEASLIRKSIAHNNHITNSVIKRGEFLRLLNIMGRQEGQRFTLKVYIEDVGLNSWRQASKVKLVWGLRFQGFTIIKSRHIPVMLYKNFLFTNIPGRAAAGCDTMPIWCAKDASLCYIWDQLRMRSWRSLGEWHRQQQDVTQVTRVWRAQDVLLQYQKRRRMYVHFLVPSVFAT